ncbi:hypothetical protein [Actinosynnema sp. NPDC020468]|uniref:hypothetical protein n=1 Tax=Actinosynnema sp. NPDC020468 TaxID=3154488 RepID=UPI0033E4A27D
MRVQRTRSGVWWWAPPAVVGGHWLMWHAVLPAAGAVVGSTPFATAAGWAFAGGGFVVLGVLLASGRARRGSAVACAVVMALCAPFGWVDDVPLPADFRAGVFAGAWGVVFSPVAAGAAAVWWSIAAGVLRRDPRPTPFGVGLASALYGAVWLYAALVLF